MKNSLVFILLSLYSLSAIFAQNTYQTQEGHILISGKYNNNTVLIESHKLNLFMDYTTKAFKGTLNLSTLDTGIDSLDLLLSSLKPGIVSFSGVIPDDDFITWEHSELKFDIPVDVNLLEENLNPSLRISINHFKDNGSNYACLLSGTMDLDLTEFENKPSELGDIIEVKFTQVLMRRN